MPDAVGEIKTIYLGEDRTFDTPFSFGAGEGRDSGAIPGNYRKWSWSWNRETGSLETYAQASAGVPGIAVEAEATVKVGDNYQFRRRCAEQSETMGGTVRALYFYDSFVFGYVWGDTASGALGAGEAEFSTYFSGTGASEKRDLRVRSPTLGTSDPQEGVRGVSEAFVGSANAVISPYLRSQSYVWATSVSDFQGGQSGFSGTSDVLNGQNGLNLLEFSVDWPNDPSPPTSSARVVGGLQGNNGWWRSDVTVEIESRDPQSCVRAIEYSVDFGPWTIITLPNPFDPFVRVSVAGDGTHTINFRAHNFHNAAESVQTFSVSIDGTPPTVQLTRPRGGHCYVQDIESPNLGVSTCATGTSLRMEASADDATSRVDFVEFRAGDNVVAAAQQDPYAGDWNLLLQVGFIETSAVAQDNAGNRASSGGPSVLVLS